MRISDWSSDVCSSDLLGARRWWRAETSRDRVALLVLWTIGWGLAVLTWAAPGVIGWLAGHVPGGGLLRDGSRFLALCVPLLVILLAHGVTSLEIGRAHV